MEYAAETFSLTKVFSDLWGRDRVRAVDDLNLKIRCNEIFGLLGPNGSGKTTTIKMLLGLLHPTKGHALCLGGDGTNPRISARIGFLPEESYLYRYLNARETLEFYGRLFGLPAKVRKMRIEALLDMVGLKAVANRPVGMFSKGMARRIGLAQALINDPDLLILDEPTTGLDPIGTRQIKDLLLHLAKRGKTILLSSHLLADVEDVCNQIAILYGGKIRAEGSVKELLQQTNKKQITTDALSDATVAKIRQLIEAEHAHYLISSPMNKLETFFIDTVAAAQQQAQPTAGAVSTTDIGDFLTAQPEKKTQPDILEQLVSSSGGEQTPPPLPEKSETRTAQPRSIETEPDQHLLDELTRGAEPAETKPVETRMPDEPSADRSEEIKKDILDQLAGTSKHTDRDQKNPDRQD